MHVHCHMTSTHIAESAHTRNRAIVTQTLLPRRGVGSEDEITDDAVKLLLSLGKGARMAKVDLKSAFRMIPVRKQDWQYLGIKWRDKFYDLLRTSLTNLRMP